ncbi:MAG: helix-turn-helix transcriptional regulator [Geothrix sp.]|uniref:helix-turn-helix domain-containing protein n=1 Tax=Geothrix sp. TaxID=1962974 RepID=UPI001828EAA0|nr:helix-turn-helix transcriptional regulator [Geothrix sp.]NWJ41015.1 helix-turn-helix transcriptional regulator [Geothrix sp.]WIL20988.1 MAG: helix-turn-helix domain-containing protein [Geothrix sp.]
MPNIASVLKEEVVRLARKELRTATEGLKKAAAAHRTEIAALKRRILVLEKGLARGEKKRAAAPVETPEDATRIRFSAKRLARQREKLGLSAADMGLLLGVSAQTVYNWEAEKSRPRRSQLAAIAALRGIGKRQVKVRLEALATPQ